MLLPIIYMFYTMADVITIVVAPKDLDPMMKKVESFTATYVVGWSVMKNI